MTSAEGRRRSASVPILLIVVAALVRAAALYTWSGHLADDRDDYLTVARQYLAHGFWESFEGYPSSFRPPLYPLLLALILRFGGGSAAIGLTQLALGTATVALTYFCGGKLGLGKLALVAATIVALDPLLIEYTSFPMTETLITFLVVLLVAVALPIQTVANCSVAGVSGATLSQGALPQIGGPCCSKRKAFRAAAVGAVFGACALCRPTIWPTVGLAALWLLWRARGDRQALRRTVCYGAFATLAIAVVVTPWALRNWEILGSPVLTTTHGGYTLLLGNNTDFFERVAAHSLREIWSDDAPDRFQQAWVQGVIGEMEREIGVGADELARDRWMYRRARESIAAHPRLFLRACLLRFLQFWNVLPLPPSRSSVPPFVVWGMCGGYVVELALFVIGLGCLIRRWDERWMLCALVIFNFTAVQLVYWTNMRMRAPLVPMIALVAAVGLRALGNRRKINKCVTERPVGA